MPLMPFAKVPLAVLTGSAEPVPAPKAAKVCISFPKFLPPIKKSSCLFCFRINAMPIQAIIAK